MNSLESEYKHIFEAANIAIAKVSLDGKWLEINDSLCNMLQYSKDELLKKTFQDVTHPDDLSVGIQHMKEMLDKKVFSYNTNKRYIKKDGSIMWGRLSVTLTLKSDGQPNYFVSTIDDITEQINAQNSLENTNKYLNTLLEISYLLVNIRIDNFDESINLSLKKIASYLEADHAYVYKYDFNNDIALNTHEWCSESIESKLENCPSIDLQKLGNIINLHKSSNYYMIEKASESKENKSTISMPLMKLDECIGFIGFDYYDRDTSFSQNSINMIKLFCELIVNAYERFESEEKIYSQKSEFETIFEYSKDGIAITDLQSNFLEFNKAYVDMTGYSREELLQKSCIGLSISEDKPKAMQTIKNTIEKGYSKDLEKSCYKKDGSLLTVNLSMSLMPDKNRILLTAKDVTQNTKLRKTLEASKNEAEVLFMDSPVAMAYVKEDESVRLNNAFCELTGYSNEEIKNVQDWFVKAYPDEKYRKEVFDRWEASFNKAKMGNGKLESNKYMFFCKNGNAKEILLGGLIIRNRYIVSFIEV